MALKTIIDADRLPTAVQYYGRFPREPSPAGTMTIPPNTVAAVRNLTLERILDEMALLKNGDEVLLVCHGTPHHLLLPLVAGVGSTAAIRALDLIWHVMRVRDQTGHAGSLSDWKKHVLRLSEVVTGSQVQISSIADAKTHLDNLLAEAIRLTGLDQPTVDRLVAKLRKVHALKLKRIEIRACDIASGAWPRARGQLRTLLRFFGCDKLVAPTTSTFYLTRFAIEAVRSEADLNNWFGSFATTHAPGPALRQVQRQQDLHVNPGPVARHRPPLLLNRLNSAVTRNFNGDVVLAVWELRPSVQYAAGAVTLIRPNDTGRATPDWTRVQKFVNDFINPGQGTIDSPFPLAGFWNTGGKTFVLPNEPEYTKALVAVLR